MEFVSKTSASWSMSSVAAQFLAGDQEDSAVVSEVADTPKPCLRVHHPLAVDSALRRQVQEDSVAEDFEEGIEEDSVDVGEVSGVGQEEEVLAIAAALVTEVDSAIAVGMAETVVGLEADAVASDTSRTASAGQQQLRKELHPVLVEEEEVALEVVGMVAGAGAAVLIAVALKTAVRTQVAMAGAPTTTEIAVLVAATRSR